MRGLTNKEKNVIKKLIELYAPGGTMRIGNILIEECNVKYMRKTEDSNLIEFEYTQYENIDFRGELIETIALLYDLTQRGYLLLSHPFEIEEIGEKKTRMAVLRSVDGKPKGTELLNPFDFDLWKFLSSYYIVTNGLRDYAKDFKTIERRQFEKQMSDTEVKHNQQMKSAKISLILALISTALAFFSVILSTYSYNNPIKIHDSQFDKIIKKTDNSEPEKSIAIPTIEIPIIETEASDTIPKDTIPKILP